MHCAMASNWFFWLLLTSQAVWLGTCMAHAASTDGHSETSRNESCLPSCQPGVTPSYSGYVFTALRPVNWPGAACKCFSTGLQSVTSKLPGCHRANLSNWQPGPGPSRGPGRRRHGWHGWRHWSRAGRPTSAAR